MATTEEGARRRRAAEAAARESMGGGLRSGVEWREVCGPPSSVGLIPFVLQTLSRKKCRVFGEKRLRRNLCTTYPTLKSCITIYGFLNCLCIKLQELSLLPCGFGGPALAPSSPSHPHSRCTACTSLIGWDFSRWTTLGVSSGSISAEGSWRSQRERAQT